MADLAVGFSRTLVSEALTKLHLAINHDSKLRQKARRDLVTITLEFEMMNSFLSVANEDRSTNNLVMTWVGHVSELAYDLEDCIEFILHLDSKPIFWRRLLPVCMVGSLPLDQAVMEIVNLKNRAEELSKCYSRYSHISEPTSKLVMLQQQAPSLATGETASKMLTEAKAKYAARKRQGLGGLASMIPNKDNEDPHLQVISVWGTGGDLGINSIIRKAYTSPRICQNFACRAWVKLAHPFNPHEFVRRFMAQVYAADTYGKQGADQAVQVLMKMKAKQEYLLKEFVEEVNKKTYLVVLENLTDIVDWDAVRTFLPDMKNGSCIIVSGQQFEVMSLCIGHSYQTMELRQFSPEHSVCVFIKEDSQDYGNKADKSMVPQGSQNSTLFTMKEKYNSLVGREQQMIVLRRYTSEEHLNNSPVISVWGIVGIGKSALVRNLYYDIIHDGKQFNKYSWVNVSHPLKLRDFSRSLISDHHSKKDPIKECREFLSQHRCLVVIDDLQSKEEWDIIRAVLVSRSSSSVIIVITSQASIATYCSTNEKHVFNVKGLDAEAAMDLFKKEVHRKNPDSPLKYHNGPEVEELILNCGGLPKVIVYVASVMARHTVTFKDMVPLLNKHFMYHLETQPGSDTLRGLFDWLYNFLYTCPDSLKTYISYLSIFPRRHNIRRTRLVRRWIAEGYSRDNEEESAVDKAENIFSQLLYLSIIQQIPQLVTRAFTETRMVACQVNDFIRGYIDSIIIYANPVFELGKNSVLTTKRAGRHLTILDSWDRDRIVFETTDFSRLRSLTVFGKWASFFISKNMRLLRVLDLEDASGVTDEDLKKMLHQMLRLKFLSLRGRSEIFGLPNFIGNLRQLQTLDVRHTSIVTLPASIGKLQKLQYIRAGTKVPASMPQASSSRLPEFRRGRGLVGVNVPSAIGKLTALHTLGVINVCASGGNAIVEELKKLTQLRKLGVSGINKHNSKEFFFETSGLVHLESLLVQLDEDSQGCMDDISLPWENIQSLKLYGLQDNLPLRNPLSKLSKLDLEMDTLQKNGMEFLAKLPKLCILLLQVKQPDLHFHAEMYGSELDSFKNVKILDVTCRSSRLRVTFGSRTMKNLELLKIDYSSALYQVTGLDDLSELKEILLKGTNDTEIKTNFERQLLSHPKKPTVKLG